MQIFIVGIESIHELLALLLCLIADIITCMNICQPEVKSPGHKQFQDLRNIASVWDLLLPENHPLKSCFLLAIQDAGLPDVQFHYLVIYKDEEPAGLAYFQHFHFHAGHYDSRALGQGPMAYLSQLLLCQETGILVCGNLFHLSQEGFFFRNQEDREILLPLVKEMEKKLRPGAVLIKDIRKPFSESTLKNNRFRSFDEDQVMSLILSPDWKSFDDYLGSLSKKYRQRAAKILSATEGLIFRELDENEIKAREGEIEALYQQVRQRQALRIGSLTGAYFSEMKKVRGKQFTVRAWLNPEGKMLAFSSHFLHPGSQREVHYIGFDTEANEKHLLYFNILFDGIRCGIENGEFEVMFGRTGFDAKASAGAMPSNNLHYFRVKRGVPGLTFQVLRKALAGREKPDWQSRNPFRKVIREIES